MRASKREVFVDSASSMKICQSVWWRFNVNFTYVSQSRTYKWEEKCKHQVLVISCVSFIDFEFLALVSLTLTSWIYQCVGESFARIIKVAGGRKNGKKGWHMVIMLDVSMWFAEWSNDSGINTNPMILWQEDIFHVNHKLQYLQKTVFWIIRTEEEDLLLWRNLLQTTL